MSLNVFWFLPTHGDGHYLGSAQGARSVDHGYLQQIAQAADRLGFGGVLIPTGRSCEDSWLVAASLIPVTQRLKFLVALRPGIISPTLAARQAATLDRLSNGRALFNLVTGGDPEVFPQLEMLVKKGSGLLLLGGYESFGNSDWHDHKIFTDMLPVELNQPGQVEGAEPADEVLDSVSIKDLQLRPVQVFDGRYEVQVISNLVDEVETYTEVEVRRRASKLVKRVEYGLVSRGRGFVPLLELVVKGASRLVEGDSLS